MQLLIIIPKQPETTGNHVTAERFAAKLPAHNWNCTIIETETDSPSAIEITLKNYLPDAVLLLHAYRSGKPWLLANAPKVLPLAVLMTGTDYNHDLHNPERAPIIEMLQQQASAIIVQNQLILPRLGKELPGIESKLQLLPPGIRLGSEPFPLRQKLKLLEGPPLFLCPAGIRPVKGNLELLLMCDQIVEQQPNFNLVFCGPALDNDYTARFFDTLDARPWAHYLGEVPKMAMAETMRQADVILNNSVSEGVSNSLVEAAALGRPILATDIIGNRALVQHGKTGLLYFSQEQFVKHALQLIRDLKLRRRLAGPNPSSYNADRECEQLASLLDRITKQTEKAQ
ncbi:GPMC system family 4 glycosyltransferase [Malonomonas rubra]|uniref:GPMC system family 4 glycosyltransferase n=1 Tax=Malonomonas rubra TaxID=57040 RepID=UPI0026F32DB1|nr:GPMC system family 4 glycosyltransferase [Malonomonas rubra]